MTAPAFPLSRNVGRRLRGAMITDFRLQWRGGFYYAAIFVAVFNMIILRFVPESWRVAFLAPVVLGNIMVGTFYFVAGLMLLERAEGSLAGLSVTPLRPAEYVRSKVATLTMLALLENGAIVLVGHGIGSSWNWAIGVPLLVAGLVLGAAVYVTTGMVAVARYRTVNEYLFPSVLWATLASVPFLPYFELWPTGWVGAVLAYLHPLQPSMTLLEAAFRPVPTWEIALALGLGVFWSALFLRIARRVAETLRRKAAP